MMDWLQPVLDFLAQVRWGYVFLVLISTVAAVYFGVLLPGRLIEAHTNQPIARWVWYVVSVLVLLMIYVAMYGYGEFWFLYGASEARERGSL
ncbi:MAG: hypothetical protein IT463_03845 [Planctomycetes bacterium]|nr:hypothetical protein [Planctomycetota bacterium]